jgi:prophage antirepressor-like protein
METTKIALFKGKQIRKTINNNEWWFLVIDVVGVLTDSANPADYIKKMRVRDAELAKGWGQIVTPLLLATEGGAQRTNCANNDQ